MRQSRRPQESTAHRADRQRLWMPLEHCTNEVIEYQETLTHQSGYKRIGIFKVRELPGRTLQIECVAGGMGQVCLAVHQNSCGQMRHERAELKGDAEKFCVFGNRGGHSFCLWPSHGQIRPALLPAHDPSPVALCKRCK